jgi:hypothetical protein
MTTRPWGELVSRGGSNLSVKSEGSNQFDEEANRPNHGDAKGNKFQVKAELVSVAFVGQFEYRICRFEEAADSHGRNFDETP